MEWVMKLLDFVCVCTVIAMLFYPVFSKAEIYQYQDKDGVLHFTDSLAELPEGQQPQKVYGKKKPKASEDEELLLKEAGNAYLKRDFKRAVKFYGKVLQIEKKEPTLDKNNWRVVADNLGMSYRALANHAEAIKMFEYGISKDGTYPMFYYHLACVYAEMNDLDRCLLNLKKAVRYKRNMIPGERFPNPATDASFARFMRNERFLKTLKEINR